MYRETGNLPDEQDCYFIIDDKTIMAQDGGTSITFKLVSNQWYEQSTQPYTAPATGTQTCYTLEDISELPSQYDFIAPIYHTLALVSALFIFWVSYRLIIYPFFRNKP